MKSQVLHTVWCNISGEATGEIWNWSLLGMKGLKSNRRCVEVQLIVGKVNCRRISPVWWESWQTQREEEVNSCINIRHLSILSTVEFLLRNFQPDRWMIQCPCWLGTTTRACHVIIKIEKDPGTNPITRLRFCVPVIGQAQQDLNSFSFRLCLLWRGPFSNEW